MRADLIERLRWNAKMSRGDHRHITADLLDEAADALASLSSPQEPRTVALALEAAEHLEQTARVHSNPHFIDKFNALARAVRAVVASPVVPVAAKAEAEGWRLIETAPKDGTHLWLYWPDNYIDDRQSTGWWEKNIDGDLWIDSADSDWNGQPSHWMPLPAAPTCEGERP